MNTILSEIGYAKIVAIANEATKVDNWLAPTIDLSETFDNYEEYVALHREEWEESTMWEQTWWKAILNVLNGECQETVDDDPDTWWLLDEAAKQVFWETWENNVDLRKFWEENKDTKE